MVISFRRSALKTEEMNACFNCPVQLAEPDFNSRSIVDRLFAAIFRDKVGSIAKLFDSGVPVDLTNRAGQTPLFCAAVLSRYEVAKLLLRLGADPNKRCSLSGCTPMHAVCWSGHVKLFTALVIAGGDLRLHDQHGRTPRDWALMQPDLELRLPILSAIESFRQAAMRDGELEHAYSEAGLPNTVLDVSTRSHTSSFTMKLPARLRSTLCAIGLAWNEAADVVGPVGSVQYTGFGKLIFGRGESAAALWPLPLIAESELVSPDEDANETDSALNALLPKGVAFRLGPISEMVPRRWNHTQVSVRRIRENYPADVLVEELQNLSRLRHTGILLLMGVCPTHHWNSIQLVFEPVMHGSLYHRLHVMGSSMSLLKRLQLLQQVCDALLFLHSRQLLHCSITSHAVHIVSSSRAKIGCFETLCENYCESRKVFRKVPAAHWDWCMPWMSPELARGEGPSPLSDVFSFCCVIWETCTERVPWQQLTCQQIAEQWRNNSGQTLPLEGLEPALPQHVASVLRLGLQTDPNDRESIDLHEIYLMLQLQAATIANNQRKTTAVPPPAAEEPRQPELTGILKHSWHTVKSRMKKVRLPDDTQETPTTNVEINQAPLVDDEPAAAAREDTKSPESVSSVPVLQEENFPAEVKADEDMEEAVTIENWSVPGEKDSRDMEELSNYWPSYKERHVSTQSCTEFLIKPASHTTERHSTTCYLSPRSAVAAKVYATPLNSPNKDSIKSGNIYCAFGSELRRAVAHPLKLHQGLDDFETWQSRVFARADVDGACALPDDELGNPDMSSTPRSGEEFLACSSMMQDAFIKSKKSLKFTVVDEEPAKYSPKYPPTKQFVSSVAAFFNGKSQIPPPKPPRRNSPQPGVNAEN